MYCFWFFKRFFLALSPVWQSSVNKIKIWVRIKQAEENVKGCIHKKSRNRVTKTRQSLLGKYFKGLR